jgi:spore germination protein KC
MIMSKIGLWVVTVVLLATTITGCWSVHGLDTLAIIVGAGLDKAEDPDKIRLAAQVAVPAELGGVPGEGGGGGAKATALAITTGYTVREAAQNLSRYFSRIAYWPDMQILVIGEEAAREGISPLLDFWNRQEQPFRSLWVMVAKGEAKDIFAAEDYLEKISAVGISKLINESGQASLTRKSRLLDVTRDLASPGVSPVLARIEAADQAEGKKRIRVAGSAVFQGDRLAGWLDESATRGLLWITGEVQSGAIVVKCPDCEKRDVSLKIRRAKSKIIPEEKDGRIAIRVEIDAEGDLGDQTCPIDLTMPEHWRSLERRQAAVIENEAAAALRLAQEEFQTDIFGFGAAIRRKFPREWEEMEQSWDEKGFPRLEVTINMRSKLRRPGLILQPNSSR